MGIFLCGQFLSISKKWSNLGSNFSFPKIDNAIHILILVVQWVGSIYRLLFDVRLKNNNNDNTCTVCVMECWLSFLPIWACYCFPWKQLYDQCVCCSWVGSHIFDAWFVAKKFWSEIPQKKVQSRSSLIIRHQEGAFFLLRNNWIHLLEINKNFLKTLLFYRLVLAEL